MKAGQFGWKERLCHGWWVNHFSLIYSSVKGNPAFLKLSAEIGWKALTDSVNQMGGGKFTELVWPLGDEDPDDAFSSIPYEKVSSLSLQNFDID